MTDRNLIIFYVDNPTASAKFYADLLEKQPVEASPTFAMFALASGLMLGLWSKQGVEPPATTGGGGELAFSLADDEGVDCRYADCCHRQLAIAQEPIQMDFGYTFVALDPDGHRLRFFAPSESVRT